MNRISVFRRGAAFAAGALGAAALTAGCSGSTAKSAGSGGTSPGSTSSAGSTTAVSSGVSPGSGTTSASATGTAPASAAGGSTSTHAAPTTAHSSASSTPSHAGGGTCTTAEMPSGTWRVVPASEGAGHVAADIALQNTSGHSCTVTGFPGVSLLASNDHPLPTTVMKETAFTVTTVTVAPGAWVHSEMRYSANMPGPGEPQSGQCEPTTVHALAQLPGDSAWAHITLDNPTPVCEKGQLQVKPFVSGKASPTGG